MFPPGRGIVLTVVLGVVGSLLATWIWISLFVDDPAAPQGRILSPENRSEVGLTQDVRIEADNIPVTAELWILVSKTNCSIPHGDSEPGRGIVGQTYDFDDVAIGQTADEDGRWTIELVMAEGPDASAEFTNYNRDPEAPGGRCPRPAGLTTLHSIQVTRERNEEITSSAAEPAVRIVAPFDGEEIPYPVDVVVEVDEGVNDDYTVWIVTKSNGWWPTWSLPAAPPRQTFEAVPVLAADEAGTAELFAVLADEEANKAFEAYVEQAIADGWTIPMEELPSSAIVVDQITVERR